MSKSKTDFLNYQQEQEALSPDERRVRNIGNMEYMRGQRLSFIDKQIKLHSKAEDILMIAKKCSKKLNKLKQELEDWKAAKPYSPIRLRYPDKSELEFRISWQRYVLTRLTEYYLKQVRKMVEPAIQDTDVLFFPEKVAV
jgi:hypothetical protein